MSVRKNRFGDSGINSYGSGPSRTNEHVFELQGREGSMKYRQMAKGDDQIGMILRVHKNPIRSCCWDIPVPDDATDIEKKAIGILNKWIFADNPVSFQTLLGQILSFMEYGFSAFEQIYQVYTFEGEKYFVPVLEQRLQTSIQEIMPKEMVVRQQTIDNGQIDIPFENMVLFILNQQGEDMRGESIIRNCYPNWKDKSIYKVWQGMGMQRSASGGIPTVTVPKGTDPDGKEYQAVCQLLERFGTGHENSYMILEDGYTFDIKEVKFDVSNSQSVINSLNAGMALSVLAQFVLLGQNGNTGAFALSRDQSDFFLDGLQYCVNLIEQTYNRHVIRPFLKINFGDAINSERVQLKGLNMNKKAGQELANILNQLKTAGFITATVDDEIHIRKALEMTPLSEEEIEKRKERKDISHQATIDGLGGSQDDPQETDQEPEDAGDSKNKPVKLSDAVIKSRNEIIEKENKEVFDFMKANLLLIKDKLIADIEQTLNRGVIEIQGLKNIDVSYAKYQKSLERKLAGIAYDAYTRAKKQAKVRNIKFAEDRDPREIPNKNLVQFVLNQAAIITEQQTTALKAKAILTASNGPLKGYSIAQTLAQVSKSMDDYIDSSGVVVGGSLVVVGTDNFGAQQFYQEIKDQLWGYRFVAVDDSNTSDICRWYNGKTFSVDSLELIDGTPPLHPNCRSYVDPIYKTEEKPKIDDVIAPKSIREQKSVY